MGLMMQTITLKNGAKLNCVVSDRSDTDQTAASGFAAELNRVSEAAKQAEAAGSTKLQAAFSSLTPSSKAVLERMKAGASDVTEDEWNRLRQELAAAGLMTQDELFYSDLHIVYIGNILEATDVVTDANGVIQIWGCSAAQTNLISPSLSEDYWNIEWTGDPLQYLGQWLKALQEQQDHLSKQFRPDGTSYDTSFYTKQIEANEKVSALVRSLLELC